MHKLFVSGGGYLDRHFAQLENAGFKITHEAGALSQEKIQALMPEFSAYILGGDERLGVNELARAEKLQLISFVGTGYTSFIDADEAGRRGISIKNTPEVMAPAVVEHTLGLMLAMQRKLFQQNRGAALSTVELSAIQIGIVGMGAIGSRLARALRLGFNSKVVYHSRSRKPQLESELGIEAVSLPCLLRTSDMIVLALPTTPETEAMLNHRTLLLVKPGAILINTAGARLVEPRALLENLRSGQLTAAAFDGYYQEPLPETAEDAYGLLALPTNQFVVTPHSAAKTAQSWSRMVDMAVKNVISFSPSSPKQ